jgi:tricorn protease
MTRLLSITGALTAGLVALSWTAPAHAVDTRDTTFLHTPAISADRIAFVYADDLWTARPDGSEVRRLTAQPGPEANPYFSPDGTHLAFTGNYDGNMDVYVVPAEGGEPARLTWHPGADVVRGFAPDGAILFSSQRSVFTQRFSQFFTVRPRGGFPTPLKLPCGDRAAYSPDGKFLAYNPLGEAFRQWKNYRGGTHSRLWIVNLEDLSVEPVPQPEERANDTYPMWIGERVYFLSDRAGEFNLFSYDRASRRVKQLTWHGDFPIESASGGAGKIIYEQAGHLFVFDTQSEKAERIKVGVAAELVETRPRFAEGAKYVRSADISPTGKRAVFEFRGEVVTVPAEKGDVHNITRSPGVHERGPAWSPDGKSIACFSDASGEYSLVVRSHDGRGEPRSYPLRGSGYYERARWSPDSKKIAFIDSARTLYVLDIASGDVKRIDGEPIYGPINTMTHAWSPDSRWLAYTLNNKAYFQAIWLYSLDSGKSTRLTDGLAETGEPVFDSSGKYLYFLVSTDAGPVKQWFDQSNADVQATYSVFLAVLDRSTPNPLLKPDEDEGQDTAAGKKGKEKEKEKDSDKDKDKDKAKSDDETKPADSVPSKTQVDFDRIAERIVGLPIPSGELSDLSVGAEGTLYYVRRTGRIPGRQGEALEGTPALEKFELKTREKETLAEKIDGYRLSADHKKVLYHSKDAWGIVDVGKFSIDKGKLPIASLVVKVEPRSEWYQMAREAWRINRDFFYAPNMHGADWSAMWSKYEPFLAEVPTRADLNQVIRLMCSELAVGHHRVGGGDRLVEPKTVPVGLLGADYEIDQGRYRFKTIYGGASWETSLHPPLVAPGVDVKAGEYLLAVDGEDLAADTDVYRLFENKVGRRVELKVGPRPDGEGARTVVVEPIASEAALRNRQWVENNIRTVHERTGGRVAYVYVPNTADLGHAYFKRYFFPQVDKQALIVDERFNGGGSVADYYIDILRRPVVSYWSMRHGATIRTPGAAILGPKVMIIDETAGSGGDLLPWMFRKFALGKLVGRRTWGGLVGTLGFPVLMDGGGVSAPDLAFYTDDGWRVENEGVPPDIEVEQWPALVAAGKDPQLDRAIEEILAELKANPPRSLPRPEFPIRVRRMGTRPEAQ